MRRLLPIGLFALMLAWSGLSARFAQADPAASAVAERDTERNPEADADAERVREGGGDAPASPDAALARIAGAAEANPGDPDLAWAWARQLARAGRGPEAVSRTLAARAKWPAHRPDAEIEIARVLLDRGSPGSARRILDDAVRRSPGSGLAHFHRGMAFRAEGRAELAHEELQAAAVLEPALRSEALLVRALLYFDAGREAEAVSLLQSLLRSDPTSDTAIRARLLLRDRELAHVGERLRVDASAGFEWDQNVTLEGAESETDPSDRADFRGVWGLGISGQPWRSERGGLLVGYRYDQTQQDELEHFNLLQNALFASLSLVPSETLRDRLALRFDVQAYDTLQDFDHALTGGALRPNLLWSIGPRAGVLRVFGSFEFTQFDDDPQQEPWERDSLSGGAGLEQVVPLPMLGAGASIALSGSYLGTWTEADASDSIAGFDGDFDADSFRVRSLGRFSLPLGLRALVEASYTRDDYRNENFSLWLDTLETKPREDDIAAGRVSLSRAFSRWTRVEVYWRGAWRSSNVSDFDYDKQIVGMLVHVTSGW